MRQGLYRNAAHEYFVDAVLGGEYAVEVGPLVSVTTGLKALDKSGPLVGWATRETAAAAIRNLDALKAMVTEAGPDAAQKWLQTKPGYIKDTAADSGSNIHMLAEAIANGQEIVSEDPKVRQYQRFVAEWQPQFVGVEQMVVNFSEGYAGTADAWCLLPNIILPGSVALSKNHPDDGYSYDGCVCFRCECLRHPAGELWLLDYKSGRGVYPDFALQLAALHNAEWWGWPDREDLEPAQRATRFGILHLQETTYDLIEYQVTPEDYEAFLAIKQAHGWTETRAKSVVLGKVKRETA